jgi:hypothetical protein
MTIAIVSAAASLGAGPVGTALVISSLAVLGVRPFISVDRRDRVVRAALGALSSAALTVLVVVIVYRFRELA